MLKIEEMLARGVIPTIIGGAVAPIYSVFAVQLASTPLCRIGSTMLECRPQPNIDATLGYLLTRHRST